MSSPQRRVLAVAVLASFVAFLDGTIVNVALPAIERDLGGGLVTQQWTVDAYLITLGSLILVAGSASDAYGRVLVLRIGLVGFGIASIAVGLAPDPALLVAARAVQGTAGALLIPSSLALITASFESHARARAIGIWTGLTTVAMIAGPILGGLLVDHASWRWAFLINVLPIAVTLWLVRPLRTTDRLRADAGIDWLGAALCTAGLGATVYALIEQPVLGWLDPVVGVSLGGGIAVFALFLARQRTTRHPVLPLALFRARNFWAGNIATALVYAALSLNGFVIAVYLQQGAGLPATVAGFASLPATLMMILLSSRSGALSDRFGPRVFMTVGPLVMAIGSLLLLTVSDPLDYWWQMLPGILLFGLGLATTVSPLTAAVLGAVGAARSGIASAVNNAVARVAGLLAVAMLATITGGGLDLAGFHRAAVVTAALLAAGGIAALLGIRNPPRESGEGRPSA